MAEREFCESCFFHHAQPDGKTYFCSIWHKRVKLDDYCDYYERLLTEPEFPPQDDAA
jgi:hypothetical protein